MTYGLIARSWWPLAMSWLLMSFEQPGVAIVVARLQAPKINLAAWGGVVFPIALVIEAPIIMMLAASTALSKDRASYLALRRFAHRAGALLTVLHLLLAFTPLYDLLVRDLLEVPAEVIEPARVGLMLMTPWTWAIAYRRFIQGALIRFGHSRAVGVGTLLRLATSGSILLIGWLLALRGIVVAGVAIAAGVTVEAIYAHLRVQPLLRNPLELGERGDDDDDGIQAEADAPLSGWAFFAFYFPLSMTPVVNLLAQPIGSAAISRMPMPLESLAVWPIVSGLVFVLQASGMAFNEVAVAHLGSPRARARLSRFALLLAGGLLALHLLIVLTPGAHLWFGIVNDLSPALAAMGATGFALALPIPALRAVSSWYQGVLVHARRTRAITESVVIFLVVAAAVLVAGVYLAVADGVSVGFTAFSLGFIAQVLWQWIRARPLLRTLA